MCLSPHEMSDEQLEREIKELEEYANGTRHRGHRQYFLNRIENLRKVLVERAQERQEQAHSAYTSGQRLAPA